MDMRDYDPAIARWTGIDPVVHFSQSTYNAFDGNPVFWADPSGADAYGNHSYSLSNNPFAGGNAAVSNTGGWSGNSGGAGFGNYEPDWGDGGNNIFSISGNIININWGAIDNDRTKYDPNSGSVKTWVDGPEGDVTNGEITVFSGKWIENSANVVGLMGMYGGTFLDMLSDRALTNSQIETKFAPLGSGLNAEAYTLQEAKYFANISKVAGTLSKYIGGAGVGLSALSIGYKLYYNIPVSTAEYVAAGIGAGFLIAGSMAGAAVAGTALAAAAPIIAGAAIIYGFSELITYTATGKTIEEHIFNP